MLAKSSARKHFGSSTETRNEERGCVCVFGTCSVSVSTHLDLALARRAIPLVHFLLRALAQRHANRPAAAGPPTQLRTRKDRFQSRGSKSSKGLQTALF
eukprot:3222743-Rhodomonas_salina.2